MGSLKTSEIFRLPPLTPKLKQFQGTDMLGSVLLDVDRSLPFKKIDQAIAVTNNFELLFQANGFPKKHF
jgi:hypothetical protein